MIIPEESTEANLKQLLESLPRRLTPVERVILCSDGTIQTALSVIFQTPVKVEVLSQIELYGRMDVIVRQVRLYAEYAPDNQVTACLAESVIPRDNNSQGFMTAITEKRMGIGQILKATHVIHERNIIGLYADENVVSRNYTITGDNLYVLITEVFPRGALRLAEAQK